jgi:hypothetical protein
LLWRLSLNLPIDKLNRRCVLQIVKVKTVNDRNILLHYHLLFHSEVGHCFCDRFFEDYLVRGFKDLIANLRAYLHILSVEIVGVLEGRLDIRN